MKQAALQTSKMSKKKLWIIIICSISALLLIAGILIYIFVINSPLWKIYQAAMNTKDRLDDILQNGKNLTSWVETLRQTYEGGKFALEADYATEKRNLSVQMKYEQSVTAGRVNYQQSTGQSIEADFSANKTELMFRFPQLLDKTFSVPLENLGKEAAGNSYLSEYLPGWVQALDGLDPDLFTDITWQTYQEEHEDAIDDLIDSIEIDEADGQIEYAEGLTTYRLTLDTPLFAELFLGYLHLVSDTRLGEVYESKLDRSIDWLEKLLLDKELTFYVGIDKNDCLSAVQLRSDGDVSSRVTVVLSGNENIWNRFGVWIDGREKFIGGLSAENHALVLHINRYTVRCEDAQRDLLLLRNEKQILSVHYENSDRKAEMAVLFGQNNLTASIEPYTETIRMLSDDPTDLFAMGLLDWLEVIAVLVKEKLL